MAKKRKTTTKKNSKKVSHSDFMKHYLLSRYPIDHSHIHFNKGFLDFIIGLVLGIIIAIIIF